jgi:hypothetical protein
MSAAPPQSQKKIDSPAIALLEDRTTKDPRSVEKFWEKLEPSGTPLVEPIAAEPH